MTDKTPGPAAPRERTNGTFADHQIPMGSGGDTHQMSDGETPGTPGLTTQQGAPVSDDRCDQP